MQKGRYSKKGKYQHSAGDDCENEGEKKMN